MLTELSAIEITAPMREELERHLRLSAGGDPAEREDAAAALRDAISHLERKLAICMAPRAYLWRTYLDGDGCARAPIGPIRSLTETRRVVSGGASTLLAPDLVSIDHFETRPLLQVNSFIPDEVEFVFDAGFGAEWSATPPDMRRAALLLAAHYFDKRHAAGPAESAAPHGVSALTAPWRPLRVSARSA